MSVPVPGEPSEQGVKVGQIFEAWSAAPGYQPMRWQVSGFRSAGWCSVTHYPGGRAERPMRVSSLLTPKLYHEIEVPVADPSEQALPFSEAAREAAAETLRYLDAHSVLSDGWAPMILAAAVDADQRLNAFLKLAALSDEERVERVAGALLSQFGPVPVEERDGYVAEAHADARAVLAALGLPVAEQETTTR